MKNKKDYNLDSLVAFAKTNFDKAINNLADLEACLESIKQENLAIEERIKETEEQVQKQNLATEKRIKEAEEQAQQLQVFTERQALKSQKPLHINQQQYFVLPNLENRIDESIADAITFFDKKCPYCDTNLYAGHFRNKIEVDHFIPVSKGGQHVPWNLLPVCKKCNRRKRDKPAKVFLDEKRLQNCENYLEKVQDKLVNEIQTQIDQFQHIKNHLITHAEQFSSLKKVDFQKIFVDILEILDIDLHIPELIIKQFDEERLLDRIATSQIRFNSSVGSKDTCIGQLIVIASYPMKSEDGITETDAIRELKLYGIKVEDENVYIANNSDPIKKLLADTPWAEEWGRPLRDLEGAEITTTMHFSSGIRSRATKLPIKLFTKADK